MWESASSDSLVYRSIQFSLTIDNVIKLKNAGFDPANMAVREIFEKGQDELVFSPKLSIMDSARIKHLALNNYSLN